MTISVCDQLSSPDSNGLQNCIVWVDSPQLVPAITLSQAEGISAAILGAMAIAYGCRLLFTLLK